MLALLALGFLGYVILFFGFFGGLWVLAQVWIVLDNLRPSVRAKKAEEQRLLKWASQQPRGTFSWDADD